MSATHVLGRPMTYDSSKRKMPSLSRRFNAMYAGSFVFASMQISAATVRLRNILFSRKQQHGNRGHERAVETSRAELARNRTVLRIKPRKFAYILYNLVCTGFEHDSRLLKHSAVDEIAILDG